MAYLLLACPKCHAAYKLQKEFAETEVVCRSCGHRWVPASGALEPKAAEPAAAEAPAPPAPAAQPAPAAPPSSPAPQALPRSAGPADALAALAQAAAGHKAAAQAQAPHPAPAPVQEEKADPLVGTAINGFKVVARIGSGGFGVVYRAFDTNLERSVAIKMLPPRIAKASQGLLDRFLREARSAAKLGHPNIVTIHQICPYKDTFYIVMELVDGGALHELLARQQRFTPAEATRVIRAAAEGLGHAHRRGIIHRDIKPGNIMLTNDSVAKVSDFGLARDVLQGRDIVGPGHSLGTPRYMAPEQALGDEPTAASDLYSLAATYYALLTGRPPFDAPTDREIMKKHVQEALPDPRRAVPDLPVAVFRFFEKAMAKEPEDRYLTAEEFIEALDRLDFSHPDGGAPPTAQALSAQIGPISAEDRGGHLTEALDRAVRRAQRQRTPTPQTALAPSSVAIRTARKANWVLWLLIGVGVAILVGGAVVAAIMLSKTTPGADTGPTPPVSPAPAQPVAPTPPPEPAAKAPEVGPTPEPQPSTVAKPPEKVQPAAKPPEPPNTIEDAAQAALDEVRKVEADPKIPREEIIRMYEENVLGIRQYAKTKAAQEAQKAIDRLRAEPEGGKKK